MVKVVGWTAQLLLALVIGVLAPVFVASPAAGYDASGYVYDGTVHASELATIDSGLGADNFEAPSTRISRLSSDSLAGWPETERAGGYLRLGPDLVAPNSAVRVATTGQQHHAISRRVAAALDDHPVLAGQYSARDPRFVTQAVDDAAHRGYQSWHRALGTEVAEWVGSNPNATVSQFESYLTNRYAQPDLLERFPNGFG